MKEIMWNALPALLYLGVFRHFSSVGKRSYSDDNGLNVKIPQFLHRILFHGVPYDIRPVHTVILTMSSLVCAVLTFILAVLMTYSRSDAVIKKEAFRFATSTIGLIFIYSVLIAAIAIAVRDRRLPLIMRVVIIILVLIAAFGIWLI